VLGQQIALLGEGARVATARFSCVAQKAWCLRVCRWGFGIRGGGRQGWLRWWAYRVLAVKFERNAFTEFAAEGLRVVANVWSMRAAPPSWA